MQTQFIRERLACSRISALFNKLEIIADARLIFAQNELFSRWKIENIGKIRRQFWIKFQTDPPHYLQVLDDDISFNIIVLLKMCWSNVWEDQDNKNLIILPQANISENLLEITDELILDVACEVGY